MHRQLQSEIGAPADFLAFQTFESTWKVKPKESFWFCELFSMNLFDIVPESLTIYETVQNNS